MIYLAVADDHLLYLKSISALLTAQQNFEVIIEASDGIELIDKLANAPKIDLCILDVKMPRMNGKDALIEIRKRWPSIKVLVVSMHNHENIIIEMLRIGANGFILKDFHPDELFSAIVSIYECGYFHTDLVDNYFSKAFELPQLNSQEYMFIKLCCEELTYKEISDKMFLSQRTVESYREALFKKLNVRSRTGLVMYAVKNGFI